MKTFAAWLTEQRLARKLFKGELASKLNLTAKTLGRYESGQSLPNPSAIAAIADFFGEDREVLTAIVRGRPVPESGKRRVVEVSDLAAEQLDELSAQAGMSTGEYIEAVIQAMRMPMQTLIFGGVSRQEHREWERGGVGQPAGAGFVLKDGELHRVD